MRFLTLLDAYIGLAINFLYDGEEISIAIKESIYILRMAYFHIRVHHTQKHKVENIIDIYVSNKIINYYICRNFVLQWVMAIAGRYNLNNNIIAIATLKMVMDYLIQRLNQQFNFPTIIYEALGLTMNGL